MARRTTRKAGRKSKSSVKVDLSNVGKAFEPSEEYAVKVIECTLEEGSKAPYFNMKLAGLADDYESTYMYHRASTSESSLWRLRPLMEAFGIEIPDGPMDIDAEDFVGREAMCSTYLDRYEGGSSVKPDEFWPLDDDGDEEDEEEDEPEFDLDELSDDEVMAIGAELGTKGKTAKTVRKNLAKLDEADVAAAFASLDEGDEDEDDEEEEETPKKSKKGKGKSKSSKVDPDELDEMSEDELDEVIEEHDLDVDLSDHKTLRKKRNAVLDALEEADLLDD